MAKHRRVGLAAVLLSLAFGPLPASGDALAQGSGSLTVASYGGRYQDGLRKAIFEPFEAATGIKIVEASGVALAKVKAMVMTRNVDVDIVEIVPSEFLVAAQQGLLERIDRSSIEKKTLAELYPETIDDYGFGFAYYSQVIAYNTQKFSSANHPHTWADVWDVQKFPGKRILPAGDYSIEPLEPALLADGVPADKLYPMDLERAYKSLSKIRPAVIKWVNSSSGVPQALVDGEADVGMANSARIIELRAQGAPVDFDWNEGIIAFDYLAIPKGSKNVANAVKFINFALRADIMADLVKLLPNGPSNKASIDLLSPDERKNVSSAPENMQKQALLNARWWSEADGSGKSHIETNMQMWAKWVAGP
jgi:putative spermidine/putrescine transport system substrate-binding protein